ncbi:hypothetical protein ACERJO_11740 [Halalkalibacter sp. AB-rgal2]|uniref:hypothetical protein n=1 Tax=Halalkalibacter sp. AB-rgal2 TaxID=3242695 RepID=UPI00359D6CCF
MKYSEALAKRLRKLINDVDGTIFDDEEIKDFILESPNIYIAASTAWTIRAALLNGDIESYSAGNERYDLTKLKDRLDHALKMADHYKELGDEEDPSSSSSFMLNVKRPEVL